MTHSANRDSPEIFDQILETAAIWQARLRDADLDSSNARKLKADFNTWLLEDPLHRQAYDEMEWLWGALDAPVRTLMEKQPPQTVSEARTAVPGKSRPKHSARTRSWHRFATAACLVLALFAGVGWQQDWATYWQSDHITAVGEQAPVELSDNSRIILNTQSALAVDYSRDERRVRLLKGEAWFDIASDPSRPFIVETAQGRVEVTGTQFNVRLSGKAAIVSLDEGRVHLHSGSRQGEALTLTPGQQAQVTLTGITAPADFDRTAVTAWLRGQFVFFNTPLGDVVATLDRYREGRILIISDDLNSLRVSGVFSTTDPNAALALITDTLPVQQTWLTDDLVLLR